MTQFADIFAVWDEFAVQPKGLSAMQNPALRDLEYIPNVLPKAKPPNKTKQNSINLEDLLPVPEKVIRLEEAYTKAHLLTILSNRS